MAQTRVVTIVATIRTTADLDRIRAAFLGVVEVPLEDYDTELIGCDWAPDRDTIMDAVNLLDDESFEVVDLNPGRFHP